MVNGLVSFIKSNNIAIKEQRTLLAVSGGVDSIAMVSLFSQLGCDFGIAHCNFGLRGKESEKDEIFVKELSIKLGVPFHVTSFDTAMYADAKGVSIQMAARTLRYKWFEEIRKEFTYDLIATAHHKGDIAETVIFNLAKGTGLPGLHGIKPQLNSLIRPLLFATRKDIEKNALQMDLSWREDSSNSSIKYSRNKIRHQVIPLLEEINPKAQQSIYTTTEKIKEAETFLHYSMAKLTEEFVVEKQGGVFINIDKLTIIPGYKFVLQHILAPFGFNYIQVGLISESLHGMSGKLFYSSSHVLNTDRGQLVVSVKSEKDNSLLLKKGNSQNTIGNISLLTRVIASKDYKIANTPKVIALDLDMLTFPLEVRGWMKGDSFFPLGMKGKKKLSDFMIDAKIPVNLKEQVLVIVSGVQIVSVLGHRLDDRYKITQDTQQIFEITII